MNNQEDKIQYQPIYHPSVEDVLFNLTNSGEGRVVGYLLGLIQKLDKEDPQTFSLNPYLEIDLNYSGNTLSKWIEIMPVHSLDSPFFRHMILRGKVLSIGRQEIDTRYRIVFFNDSFISQNVYLFLGLRNTFDYNDLQWKSIIFNRYWVYENNLKYKYKSGLTPEWSVP